MLKVLKATFRYWISDLLCIREMKLNYKDDMTQILYHETWPRGYKTFLCLTQLSIK